MAKKKRAHEELEAEIKYLKISKTADRVASVVNSAIRWGGIVCISYFAYLSINILAGKNTTAEFKTTIIADLISADHIFKFEFMAVTGCLFFGIFGILFGLWQRHLRMNTVERLQGRNQEMEKQIDKRRSSSKLTSRGETRREDM